MSDHDSRMRRNLRLMQGHALFLNMSPVIPVIVPYYQAVLGLDFRQFMIGEGLFSCAVILMEVPTGWLSDVWTRRNVMILGTLVNIVGWIMLWQADGFLMASSAQMVIGVGVSLLSGTNSAMIYESLLDLGRGDEFRRREGLRHGTGLYAAGLCAIAGGFLYAWHPAAPIIATWATSLVALALAFLLSEPTRHRTAERRHPLADMAATMRYALHGHGEVAAVIFFSALLFATTKMMFWAQQPYYARVGLPVTWYGVFMAAGFLLGGLGGHFGHRLDRRGGNMAVLRGCFLFVFAACVVAALWPLRATAVLLLSGSAIFGVGFPRVQDILSRLAPPDRRATILSTSSLVTHMFSVPLLVVTGWVTQAAGVQAALGLLVVLLAGGGCAMLGLRRRAASL